jgi:hypothetical protein
MFFKNKYKKINNILLIVLILGLLSSSLFFAPMKTQACLDKNGEPTRNCYSCDSAGECVSDADGPYWCAQCFGKCGSTSSELPAGPIDVTIVGPTPSCMPVSPDDFFGTISSIYDGAEMANNTIDEIVSIIQNDENIPENLKPYVISSIQNAENIPENTKNLLIDIVQNNEKIPENLKSLLIGAINNNKDLTGLIKSWVLDLLLKHVDIEHICKSLSDIFASMTVFGTSVGTPIAMFVTQMCPIILNEILQTFLETLPEPPAPENTQVIQYPIFESYQWEIGIPGFFKPGEITPFK